MLTQSAINTLATIAKLSRLQAQALAMGNAAAAAAYKAQMRALAANLK